MNIETINKERMNDFKKVLTFNLVTKIKKEFKGNVNLFYSVPHIWKKFKNYKLTNKNINPFQLIAMFNTVKLSRTQVKSIFGKYPNCKTFTIPYSELIKAETDIDIKKYGMFKSGQRIIHHANVYLLPFEFIKNIFDNPELLEQVCDAGSGYYSDRQRRLIFTQILDKKKNYHYKTNKQLLDEMTEEQKIEQVLKDIDMEDFKL